MTPQSSRGPLSHQEYLNFNLNEATPTVIRTLQHIQMIIMSSRRPFTTPGKPLALKMSYCPYQQPTLSGYALASAPTIYQNCISPLPQLPQHYLLPGYSVSFPTKKVL